MWLVWNGLQAGQNTLPTHALKTTACGTGTSLSYSGGSEVRPRTRSLIGTSWKGVCLRSTPSR